MKKVLLVALAALLLMPVVAVAAPEPGNPDMVWTLNGTYDGVEIRRAPVVTGKCSVVQGPFTVPTGGTLQGTVTTFTDTAPLAGRSCYCAAAFILIDFSDGNGPTKSYMACSPADTTKPKGISPFRLQ